MYKDIGKKIKGLAFASFIIETVALFVTGMVVLVNDPDYSPLALAFMLGGPLAAYLSSLILYGFGELVDKVCDIEKRLTNSTCKPTPSALTTNPNETHKQSFGEWVESNKQHPTNNPVNNPVNNAVWVCTSCGQKNANTRTTCLKCGNEKS